MIRLILELRKGTAGREQDWQVLKTEPFDNHDAAERLIAEKLRLSICINDWLELSGVRPAFFWLTDKYGDFELIGPPNSGTNILAPLAVALMLRANGSTDYAVCSGCQEPFLLRKGQTSKGRVFCLRCGRKVAQREAVRRYQLKLRDAQPGPPQYGQLKEQQVASIRERLGEYEGRRLPPGFVKELAADNQVSVWTIYKIKAGKRWQKS